MHSTDARVRMRYRPSADLLLGQVELVGDAAAAADLASGGSTDVATDHDDRVEHLDADTTRTWRIVAGGPHHGRAVLTGFQLVGAAARLRSERTTLDEVLPGAVARAAAQMITAAARASAHLGTDDRVRARAEVELPLPLVELLAPPVGLSDAHRTPAVAAADLGSTRALASALTHLADAVESEHAVLAARHLTDPTDQSERFVDAVRTLASIVSTHRRPAPGAAGAAMESVRGGLPLTGSERARVRRALADIHEVHHWRRAASVLEALAATLDEQRARRAGRSR